MQPNNHLKFRLCEREIPVTRFVFQHSLDALCAVFEATIPSSYLTWIFAKTGAEISIEFANTSRSCLLDAVHVLGPSEITLSGRDKTSLLVDSSAEIISFPAEQDFLSLCQILTAPFGISLLDPEQLGHFRVKNFAVTPGDSVWDVLSEAAQKGGVFLSSDSGQHLRLRSVKPPEKIFCTIDDTSPLLSLSIQRNMSDVCGRYIGLIQKPQQKNSRIVLHDQYGHPHKRRYIPLHDPADPASALALEAITRRRRSLTIAVEYPGFQPVPLGARVRLLIYGLELEALVQEFEYNLEPAQERTRLHLGGL